MKFPVNVTKKKWLEWSNKLGKGFAVDLLGVEIVDVNDESITLRLPISNKVKQPFGLLHGGISLFLAETAGSMHSAWGINLNEKVPVGIEINASHVRSADSGVVLAIAKVVRKSTHLVVHNIEIIHEESGKLLSSARMTNFYKKIENAE